MEREEFEFLEVHGYSWWPLSLDVHRKRSLNGRALGFDALFLISKIRQISEDTVLTHLSSMIRLKVVPWEKVLEPGVRDQVLKVFKKLGTDSEQPLKRTFEALDGKIGYGVIRCALASQ
jgi:hypothetical protein